LRGPLRAARAHLEATPAMHALAPIASEKRQERASPPYALHDDPAQQTWPCPPHWWQMPPTQAKPAAQGEPSAHRRMAFFPPAASPRSLAYGCPTLAAVTFCASAAPLSRAEATHTGGEPSEEAEALKPALHLPPARAGGGGQRRSKGGVRARPPRIAQNHSSP
jgi:hypothetical protein